jgi:hypothetical protein
LQKQLKLEKRHKFFRQSYSKVLQCISPFPDSLSSGRQGRTNMLPQKKYFSLEEANAVLPQLENLVTRLIEKKESHDRMHDHLFMSELLHDAIKTKNPSREQDFDSIESGAQSVDERVGDLENDLRQIKALGCLLRSLERGWVEFPSQKSGQTIFYCWKKGEPQVSFYRPVQSATFERFPL